MASRISLNNMRNFPVKTAAAAEGALTRTDIVGPDGGIIEGAVTRAAPIAKGDLVRLYASESATGVITVEKATAANDADFVHGIAVSSPQGIDNTTVSGQVPVGSLRRKVDVAFFGLGIVELEANGAIVVGHAIELSESESNVVGDQGAAGTNGQMIAMTLGADGVKIAVLVGYSGYQPAD